MMPTCANYIVFSCESGQQFWNACVRVAISSPEEAKEWLSEFESINSLDFRVRKTQPSDGSNRIVYKVIQPEHPCKFLVSLLPSGSN